MQAPLYHSISESMGKIPTSSGYLDVIAILVHEGCQLAPNPFPAFEDLHLMSETLGVTRRNESARKDP